MLLHSSISMQRWFIFVWFCDDIRNILDNVCPHTESRCPGHIVSLHLWSVLSVSDKWGPIILNSAHLMWCVCQMIVRRVRTLSDVSFIDSFSLHRSSDSYLWCGRDQRKACSQQHIRSHGSSPDERKWWWENWLNKRNITSKKRAKNTVLTALWCSISLEEDRFYSTSKAVQGVLWDWQREGGVTDGFLTYTRKKKWAHGSLGVDQPNNILTSFKKVWQTYVRLVSVSLKTCPYNVTLSLFTTWVIAYSPLKGF